MYSYDLGTGTVNGITTMDNIRNHYAISELSRSRVSIYRQQSSLAANPKEFKWLDPSLRAMESSTGLQRRCQSNISVSVYFGRSIYLITVPSVMISLRTSGIHRFKSIGGSFSYNCLCGERLHSETLISQRAHSRRLG